MSSELLVYLDGDYLGLITQTRQGSLGFTYDPGYLERDRPTPLSLSMPVTAEQKPNRIVRAFLEGLLPDNQAVRERWGTAFGVSANNPFALLRHVGRDAAGAVQILPPGEASDDAAHRTGDIAWLTDEDFLGIVRSLAEHRDWDPERQAGRWSLAGAQSKVALFRDPSTGMWGIPQDATPTTHIIKPAIPGLDNHHINEVLCQRAATELGLAAASCELVDFGDVRAIVSTRYDRRHNSSGQLRRVHQEDLCQALAVHPSQKYQADGGPGIGEIADLFARLGVADRPATAQRFFDGLVYNVLIGGTDAHAKNYSMLLHGQRAQLAPLYDLASAVVYPSDRPLESSMKVGAHRTMREISSSDWARAGQRLGIGADAAVSRVLELRNALPMALDAAVASLPASAQGRARGLTEQIGEHAAVVAPSWTT
ncbi:MAG: type II toxin-antitoxin system HipA family toxin [Micropruina sp.]|nr:type II toxin-antitoxin system HipA family toxin [Micropruina sp.]